MMHTFVRADQIENGDVFTHDGREYICVMRTLHGYSVMIVATSHETGEYYRMTFKTYQLVK